MTIFAGLPSFIAKGWQWEWHKAWKLAGFPLEFPKISIPEVELPGPEADSSTAKKLGANQPKAITTPGTMLFPK